MLLRNGVALAVVAALAACSSPSRSQHAGPTTVPAAFGAPAAADGQTTAAAAPDGAGSPASSGIGVAPAVLPSAAQPGQVVTALFQTRPGSMCRLTVSDDKGKTQTPAAPAVANGSGQVSWTWRLSPETKASTVTAWVACSGGAIGQAELRVA